MVSVEPSRTAKSILQLIDIVQVSHHLLVSRASSTTSRRCTSASVLDRFPPNATYCLYLPTDAQRSCRPYLRAPPEAHHSYSCPSMIRCRWTGPDRSTAHLRSRSLRSKHLPSHQKSGKLKHITSTILQPAVYGFAVRLSFGSSCSISFGHMLHILFPASSLRIWMLALVIVCQSLDRELYN